MNTNRTRDRAPKEIAKEAWMEAWHKRVGEENLDPMTKKAGESLFEKWWKINYEQTSDEGIEFEGNDE